MTVVSVSMPEELLERIDEFSDEHGYTGRSEVVRDAARDLLGEFEDARLEDRDLMRSSQCCSTTRPRASRSG